MTERTVQIDSLDGTLTCSCGSEAIDYCDEKGGRSWDKDGEAIHDHVCCRYCAGICHVDEIRDIDSGDYQWGVGYD